MILEMFSGFVSLFARLFVFLEDTSGNMFHGKFIISFLTWLLNLPTVRFFIISFMTFILFSLCGNFMYFGLFNL